MNKVFFILVFLISQSVFAWSVKEVNEEIVKEDDLTLTISSLRFKSAEGKEVSFKPSIDPYILSEVKKYEIDNKSYFLSTWVGGASSIVIRVFNPEESNLPVCQEVSDAEFSDLRKNKNVLEVKVTRAIKGKAKETWVPCHRLSNREVNGKVTNQKTIKVQKKAKAKK